MKTFLRDPEIARLGGLIHHITWHWTAGSWKQTFPHYHFCVTFDEATGKARVVQTRSLTEPGGHVYHRNTGNVGISMCGMGRIRERQPDGTYRHRLHAIQGVQVEATAKLTAELSNLLTVDLAMVHDHAHWATVDGYGPGSGHRETRIDVGSYEPVLRKKAHWYLDQMASGKAKPEYTLALF